MTIASWRHQKIRAEHYRIRDAHIMKEIVFEQRASESRLAASQIIIYRPGGWKSEGWAGIKKLLLSGEGC